MTIRFDDAWRNALSLADELTQSGANIVLVRDIQGRLSLILDAPATDFDRAELSTRIEEAVGAFAADAPVLLNSDLFDADLILGAQDIVVIRERDEGLGRLSMLERTVVGVDWTRLTLEPSRNHVTLYGFKGGVGRSTATFMLAQHLAAQGQCVLVVDLDLESPGITALLQDNDGLPDYGIVDHLVEAAVGNAVGLDLVVRSRAVQTAGNGEVWLAPASGRQRAGYDYLAKMNRVYTDLPSQVEGQLQISFGERLAIAIAACESEVASLSRTPDVVLLDSRSGVHDIAAVAITQLSNLSLLFATDSPATWNGYRSLFAQWARVATHARVIRQRLRMVAPFVVEGSEAHYLASFRDHAQACFADTLYDDVAADESEESDAYNPAPSDPDAPHAPLPILFNSDLVGLDPTRRPEWSRLPLVEAAYAEFLDSASRLIVDIKHE
jgi:hypothetical protein